MASSLLSRGVVETSPGESAYNLTKGLRVGLRLRMPAFILIVLLLVLLLGLFTCTSLVAFIASAQVDTGAILFACAVMAGLALVDWELGFWSWAHSDKPKAPAVTGVPTSVEAPAAEDKRTAEDRLNELRRLLDRDLIDRQEYERKRTEILGSL